jgi:hypothetical protein
MPLLLNVLLLSSLVPFSTGSPLNRLAALLHLEHPPKSQDTLLNTTAAPVKDVKHAQGMRGRHGIRGRSTCENPCGYYGQLCCPVGAACLTDALGQAQCGAAKPEPTATMALLHKLDQIAAPSGGSWQLYTSTWVETDLTTRTAVYTSWVKAAVTQAVAACDYAAQQQSCGATCCPSGYYCFDPSAGVCSIAANAVTTVGVGGGGGSVVPVVGTAPARVTTISGVVVTQTVSPTATTAFLTPVPTGYVNGTLVGQPKKGLSSGAIAGIVIGTLLAVTLLGLICCCVLAKDCIEAVLAFFGCGTGRRARRRTSRETIISEEIDIQRRRRDGRSWAGSGSADDSYRSRRSYDVLSRRGGGRRPPSPRRSGGGGLGGIGTALAAGLGTAGLMRMFGGGAGGGRQTERRTEKSSYHGGSYRTNSGMLLPGDFTRRMLTLTDSWDSRDSRDSRDRRTRVSSVRRTSEIRGSRRGESSRR